MIPKIIHYCWLSADPYPEKILYCVQSWKKIMPDYEIWLWDLNRFDINQSIWVKEAYAEKKYAFAADYIRLYALYKFGGIYLDSDVEVVRRFDDLLSLPYFIGFENEENKFLEAAIIGAEKNIQWVGKCLEYYSNRHFVKNGLCDMLPLPKILKNEIGEMCKISSVEEFDYHKNIVQVFPKTYFSPKVGVSGDLSYFSEKTYSIHHYAASWYPMSKKLYRRINHLMGAKFAQFCSKIFKIIKNNENIAGYK